MKVSASAAQLVQMIRDARPEHRISALWTLRQIGWWQLINEVGRVAKDDTNMKVRRYALGVLKGVAELARKSSAEREGRGMIFSFPTQRRHVGSALADASSASVTLNPKASAKADPTKFPLFARFVTA